MTLTTPAPTSAPVVDGPGRSGPTTGWPGHEAVLDGTGRARVRLDQLLAQLRDAAGRNVGFPAATDIDYTGLGPFLGFMLNDLGDPMIDGAYPLHVKGFERDVISWMADRLRAPAIDRWGYVASGTTEGTLHGLHLARTTYPDAVVYYSRAAHHSINDTVALLRLPAVVLRVQEHGEVDYEDLAHQLGLRRDRPAVVVANAGTALTEAVDDVRRITALLADAAVDRRWIHVDAALAGIPLALLDPADRPGFDLADGADSIVVSGHKWFGVPVPSAVVLTRASRHAALARTATYTGSPNTTIANSRSGLAVLALWWALHSLTLQEHRARANTAREIAAYACRRLREAGIDAWRLPHAVTVTLPTPPPVVTARWPLAVHGDRTHLVCVPGVTRADIDAFLADYPPPLQLEPDSASELASEPVASPSPGRARAVRPGAAQRRTPAWRSTP